jgi:hypothetical protein
MGSGTETIEYLEQGHVLACTIFMNSMSNGSFLGTVPIPIHMGMTSFCVGSIHAQIHQEALCQELPEFGPGRSTSEQGNCRSKEKGTAGLQTKRKLHMKPKCH